MVRQRWAWHDITALGQHTRSDYVGHCMKSLNLDSTHGGTTSGVACHHRLWAAHMIERRGAWHSIIALRRQTRSNDNERDMPSPGSTHDRMTSGVACHHRLWAAQTVERRQALHPIIAIELAHTVGWRRAWHAIIALGRQTRSNDVGHGNPSSP